MTGSYRAEGKEFETEDCPNTLSPHHGQWAGASFTRCHSGDKGLLLPSQATTWQSEKSMQRSLGLCCKLNSEVLLGACKQFSPQAVLQTTKLCFHIDRDFNVLVAGYNCCVKGISDWVFEDTGLSSPFSQGRVPLLPCIPPTNWQK